MRPLLSTISKLYSAILGLIGVGIIVLATSRYNAGVTPDSIEYIVAARNIADGNGIILWNGPLIIEPPLYPIVLAVVDYVFKIDPLISARFINALLFGLIVYLSGLLFKKHLRSSPVVGFLGTLMVLFSPILVGVSLMVWTESLFISIILLYFIFSDRYIQNRDTTSLILLSLAISLASLSRYIGMILILTGSITIIFFGRDKLIPKTKIRHFLLFISISILPIAVYIIRNYILSGSLIGYNPIQSGVKLTHIQLLKNIYGSIKTLLLNILSWYVPERIADNTLIIHLFGLAILFVILFVTVKEYKAKSNNLDMSKNSVLTNGDRYLFPILVFTTVYTAYFVLTIKPEWLEPRYFSPVFIPITLFLLVLAEMLIVPFLSRISLKYGSILFLAIVVIWLLYPIRATTMTIIGHMEKGNAYTSVTWKTSETIQYLNQHPELEIKCRKIYTNGNDALYLFTGLKTNQSPRNALLGGVTDVSLLRSTWPQENKNCLIWFDNITWRKYLFTPEELISIVDLIKVIRFQDGAIYVVSKK